jgi:hypothetical protein
MNETEATAWANGPLDFDVAEAMPQLEAGMRVRFMATFPFEGCRDDDEVREVVSRFEEKQFDFIPVTDQKRHVVGVFHRREHHGSNRLVREAMRPLTSGMLLSADAPLFTFVEKADERPYCLVVDGEDINGIVTLSDLQKLPVRPALFLLVTHLELLIVEWMRRIGEATWLTKLRNGRVGLIRKRHERLQDRNLRIDLVCSTDLSDKFDVVVALNLFGPEPAVQKELSEIRALRNLVAHGGDYGAFPEDALKVPGRVRNVRKYIGLLHDLKTKNWRP